MKRVINHHLQKDHRSDDQKSNTYIITLIISHKYNSSNALYMNKLKYKLLKQDHNTPIETKRVH